MQNLDLYSFVAMHTGSDGSMVIGLNHSSGPQAMAEIFCEIIF